MVWSPLKQIIKNFSSSGCKTTPLVYYILCNRNTFVHFFVYLYLRSRFEQAQACIYIVLLQ